MDRLLIPIIAANGESGYVRRIEELKASSSDSIDTIPVYDLDSNTIGAFKFDMEQTSVIQYDRRAD